MFKKRRGIRLSYNKQGLIHFICVNYDDMPFKVQQKIDCLCSKVGGENYKALFELITNDSKSVLSVSLEYFVSERRLYEMRKEFYELW